MLTILGPSIVSTRIRTGMRVVGCVLTILTMLTIPDVLLSNEGDRAPLRVVNQGRALTPRPRGAHRSDVFNWLCSSMTNPRAP